MHREETIIRSIKKNSRNGTVSIMLNTLKSIGSGPANTAPHMLKSAGERSHKYYEEHKDELNQKRRQKRAEENELSKTDPEVAAKREERLAKQREYNRRYREKKRAEKAEAKAQTESGI